MVAVGDLSSPFFPGPFKDLACGSPRGRAAQDAGCLGPSLVHAWSLRTLLLALVTQPREESCPQTSRAQPAYRGLGEDLDTKSWCSQGQETCTWSMKTTGKYCGESIPKGFGRNQSAAGVLKLPRSIAQS